MEHKTQYKTMNDWVSVIVPTYERAGWITKSLDTVWGQTYRPIELLIVDDGSTDETENVVDEWIKKHNGDDFFITKYFYQKNNGPASARNVGIRHSRGRYLQFLDSDDLMIPEKISLQVDLMRHEGTPICIGDYLHVDKNGQIISAKTRDYTIQQIIEEFIAVLTVPPLVDRTCFNEDMLLWNSNISKKEDKGYYIKLLMVIDRLSYVNKYLYRWVRHSESITKTVKTGRKVYWDILKSLIIFNIKHCWSISRNNYIPITRLYIKLLRQSLRIGTFLRSLRMWKK